MTEIGMVFGNVVRRRGERVTKSCDREIIEMRFHTTFILEIFVLFLHRPFRSFIILSRSFC